MGRLIAVVLICFIIIGLSSESSQVVTGGGSDGTTPLPVINPRQPSLPSPRDPSTFVHPILPNLPNPKPNPSSTNSAISANGSISSPTISFSMTSRVVGTSSSISHPSTGAGFSERRYLIADNGLDAKQTSSALNGNLDESRFISFYKDQQESTTENASTAVLISEDQTKFFGTYYNDRAVYSNEGDFVRNSFSSGDISKNSTFIGGFNDFGSDEKSYVIKSTMYNLDSRNVGITNLDLISRSENSSSEISEQYSGENALAIKFNNDLNVTYNVEKYDWLPCCLSWLGGYP